MVQEPSVQVYSDLFKQKQEAESRNMELMVENDKLKVDNSNLKTENNELAKKNKEFEKTKEELVNERKVTAGLNADLEKKNAEYKKVSDRRYAETLKLERLKNEYSGVDKKFEKLEAEKAVLIAKLDKDRSADTWKKEVSSLQAKLKETEEKLGSTAGELEKQKEIARNSAKDYRGLVVANGKSFEEKNCFEVLFSDFI